MFFLFKLFLVSPWTLKIRWFTQVKLAVQWIIPENISCSLKQCVFHFCLVWYDTIKHDCAQCHLNVFVQLLRSKFSLIFITGVVRRVVLLLKVDFYIADIIGGSILIKVIFILKNCLLNTKQYLTIGICRMQEFR